MDVAGDLGGAFGIGCCDHALEEIFFDTLAEREMAEILGHEMERELVGP